MEMEASSVEEATYEDRLAEIAKIRPLYEVWVSSWRFGVRGRFEARTLQEVQEFVRLAVDAARVVHGETVVRPRYRDEYEGVENLVDENDDEFLEQGWRITVNSLYSPSRRDPSIPERVPSFLFGHRYGANRVANPDSKVFVSYGGTDCDGGEWGRVSEYLDLHDAAKGCHEQYEWADGPMSWSVITKFQFETYGRSS